jgi:GTPase
MPKKDDIITSISDENINEELFETKQYILLDSAGIRKAGQRQFGAENFAVFKTITTAYQSDLICIVVDGSQPLSHQDQVVAGIAKEAKKSIIIVANKADLVNEDDKKQFERDFYKRFDFLKVTSFLWVSATEQIGINDMWDKIDEAIDLKNHTIPASKMRTLFNYLMRNKPPKKLRTEKKPVIYDFLYKGNNPHTFEMLIKEKKTLDKNYIRFLENFVRDQFDLKNSGIKIVITEVEKKHVMN